MGSTTCSEQDLLENADVLNYWRGSSGNNLGVTIWNEVQGLGSYLTRFYRGVEPGQTQFLANESHRAETALVSVGAPLTPIPCLRLCHRD